MTMGRPRTTPPAETNLVLEHRLRVGWSQERLAEEADLSPGQVQRIETGKRTLSQRSLLRLAKALCVLPRELLPGGNGSDPANAVAVRWARLMRELKPEQVEAVLTVGEAMLPTKLRRSG